MQLSSLTGTAIWGWRLVGLVCDHLAQRLAGLFLLIADLRRGLPELLLDAMVVLKRLADAMVGAVLVRSGHGSGCYSPGWWRRRRRQRLVRREVDRRILRCVPDRLELFQAGLVSKPAVSDCVRDIAGGQLRDLPL